VKKGVNKKIKAFFMRELSELGLKYFTDEMASPHASFMLRQLSKDFSIIPHGPLS
jgi:hypothetical protein